MSVIGEKKTLKLHSTYCSPCLWVSSAGKRQIYTCFYVSMLLNNNYFLIEWQKEPISAINKKSKKKKINVNQGLFCHGQVSLGKFLALFN